MEEFDCYDLTPEGKDGSVEHTANKKARIHITRWPAKDKVVWIPEECEKHIPQLRDDRTHDSIGLATVRHAEALRRIGKLKAGRNTKWCLADRAGSLFEESMIKPPYSHAFALYAVDDEAEDHHNRVLEAIDSVEEDQRQNRNFTYSPDQYSGRVGGKIMRFWLAILYLAATVKGVAARESWLVLPPKYEHYFAQFIQWERWRLYLAALSILIVFLYMTFRIICVCLRWRESKALTEQLMFLNDDVELKWLQTRQTAQGVTMSFKDQHGTTYSARINPKDGDAVAQDSIFESLLGGEMSKRSFTGHRLTVMQLKPKEGWFSTSRSIQCILGTAQRVVWKAGGEKKHAVAFNHHFISEDECRGVYHTYWSDGELKKILSEVFVLTDPRVKKLEEADLAWFPGVLPTAVTVGSVHIRQPYYTRFSQTRAPARYKGSTGKQATASSGFVLANDAMRVTHTCPTVPGACGGLITYTRNGGTRFALHAVGERERNVACPLELIPTFMNTLDERFNMRFESMYEERAIHHRVRHRNDDWVWDVLYDDQNRIFGLEPVFDEDLDDGMEAERAVGHGYDYDEGDMFDDARLIIPRQWENGQPAEAHVGIRETDFESMQFTPHVDEQSELEVCDRTIIHRNFVSKGKSQLRPHFMEEPGEMGLPPQDSDAVDVTLKWHLAARRQYQMETMSPWNVAKAVFANFLDGVEDVPPFAMASHKFKTADELRQWITVNVVKKSSSIGNPFQAGTTYSKVLTDADVCACLGTLINLAIDKGCQAAYAMQSIKQEFHPQAKLAEGRYRILGGMSGADRVIDTIAFGPLVKTMTNEYDFDRIHFMDISGAKFAFRLGYNARQGLAGSNYATICRDHTKAAHKERGNRLIMYVGGDDVYIWTGKHQFSWDFSHNDWSKQGPQEEMERLFAAKSGCDQAQDRIRVFQNTIYQKPNGEIRASAGEFCTGSFLTYFLNTAETFAKSVPILFATLQSLKNGDTAPTTELARRMGLKLTKIFLKECPFLGVQIIRGNSGIKGAGGVILTPEHLGKQSWNFAHIKEEDFEALLRGYCINHSMSVETFKLIRAAAREAGYETGDREMWMEYFLLGRGAPATIPYKIESTHQLVPKGKDEEEETTGSTFEGPQPVDKMDEILEILKVQQETLAQTSKEIADLRLDHEIANTRARERAQKQWNRIQGLEGAMARKLKAGGAKAGANQQGGKKSK
jgi:hypothetical protein